MPWGGSEKHQSAHRRRQTSKALSVRSQHCSIHPLLKTFPTREPDKLRPGTDYGAVELNTNWAHLLEMLSSGLGALTVTLKHSWKSQIESLSRLLERIICYGSVCWEDTLKSLQRPYQEWSTADKTSAPQTRPEGTCAKYGDLTESKREKSARGGNSNTYLRDSTKPFMGRGPPSVTSPPWSCKVTLWTLLLPLLLSAMVTTVSPFPVLESKSKTEKESENLPLPDPRETEFVVEEEIDVSIKATWLSTYENVTLDTNSEDELADNVRFRSERSPGTSEKPKKKNKGNGQGDGKKGEHGKKGEKGCSRQSIRVKVRDLGLGFDSDELITFFYCTGSCQQYRSNYDVTVTALLKNKHITHGRVSSHPCCRPTSYLPVSFMDVKNEWKVVDKLSAANCSCVR
ncbi:artemin [Gastrophryne carolinensis]